MERATDRLYIDLILESGASVKEAQALARHYTPQMTMGIYASARDDHMIKAVESIGKSLEICVEHVESMQCKAVGFDQKNISNCFHS